MNLKIIIPAVLVLLILLAVGGAMAVKNFISPSGTSKTPTPTPLAQSAVQLTPDKYPKVSMAFTADGRYATVNLTEIHAANLEYNLIYEAVVKKNLIQTGVSGSARLDGKSEYSNKQLLGSESSGKFTYHENISNAVIELTLRDDNGYSIFSGTYPFSVAPGKTVELTLSQ